MWRRDGGALPVCDQGNSQELVGVITDRDIAMRALLGGKPLAELNVGGAMGKSGRSLCPSDSLTQAERVMRD